MALHCPTVLPDTNYLMEYPFLYQEEWLVKPIEILISETVCSELYGLTQNTDPSRAQKARRALDEIEKFKGPISELVAEKFGVKVLFVDRITAIKPPLDPRKPDHQIIAQSQKMLSAKQPRFCAILSNDKELSDIAEALTVIVINRHNDQRFHEELKRKYEWWEKSHKTNLMHGLGKPIQTEKHVVQEDSKRDALLTKTAKRLQRRMKAAGNESALYIAPHHARMELARQIIENEEKLKNRGVLIVVESIEEANYWKMGLFQKGTLPSSEINIIGTDDSHMLSKCFVQICSYQQIEEIFPLYATRLKQSGKRLSTIVDGCDRMDPVLLAGILHNCDSFFGINHFPIGYRQAPANRLLNLTLHNNLILNYTFADAERDGWGQGCNLVLHKINFTSDEEELWNELNNDFAKRQQLAITNHPELASGGNFWEALTHLLSRTVDPEDVDLIKLREQREQAAQLAQNKAACTLQLMNMVNIKPYRRLILDFERQWTPVLTKLCEKENIRLAELNEKDDQRNNWDHFAGNGLDALIFSKIPDRDLPKANYQQLIILTPLRSMIETISVINWALTHTHSREPLRVDLLYTDGTPEELAMLELAEASLGLNPR